MGQDNELLKRLRAAFRQEAEERLRAMSALLIELENSPLPEKHLDISETVFREAHSLKGAARSAGLDDIEKILKCLESVFSALKRRQIMLTAENFDLLHKAVDAVGKASLLSGEDMTGEAGRRMDELAEKLSGMVGTGLPPDQITPFTTVPHSAPAKVPAATGSEPEKKMGDHGEDDGRSGPAPAVTPSVHDVPGVSERTALPETVRISVDKLDRLMRQAQEMLELKLIAGQAREDHRELIAIVEGIQKKWARFAPETRALRCAVHRQDDRVFSEKVGRQSLASLFDTLEDTRNHLRLLEGKLQARLKSAEQTRHGVGLMVDALVQDVKQTLMLPFSFFLEAVPKMVRDLSRDQGKEIRLTMEGSDVEVDRRILEQMRDPLIHVLRNSVDHGIEKPGKREALNKPRSGTITVSIQQVDGNKVEILVADDGAGVDLDRVRTIAVKRGFITGDQAREMDDEAAMAMVFESELTTSPLVTDLSGRGLGLAIVRERVEKLGGKIFIQSEPGDGTTIRIIIPVTLATFRGLLLRAGACQFIVPTVNVEKATRVLPEAIKTVENRQTVSLNGRTFAFARLDDVLGLTGPGNGGEHGRTITAILVSAGGKQLAFGVDEVVNEEEVLQKPLGPQLVRVRNISGAAVLGSGQVTPILNVADLIKSAAGTPSRTSRMEPAADAGKKISILVAEDSITSRMLLKNILESSGYSVKTATDGLEALTELKEGNYDLLVSDVDMPRMNGFVLTENVRANKKLSELPVILVTALQSREDRERGVDVGASAYIVKSSFDQSNLLDVIRKLV